MSSDTEPLPADAPGATAVDPSPVRRVVLTTMRGPAPGIEQNRDRALRIARSLAERAPDCQVHWVCPVGPDEHVAQREELPANTVFDAVETVAPTFFDVWGRVSDPKTELAVATALRESPADAVHVLSSGYCDSATLPWVSARLGFPAIVDVRLARSVCHRGDLVHAQGSNCDEWMDPKRCFDCCRTATARGPSRRDARRWRFLSFLRGYSPYPLPLEFHNRRDLVIGALQGAVRVRVESEAERDALVRSGLIEKAIVVQSHDVVDDALLSVYCAART